MPLIPGRLQHMDLNVSEKYNVFVIIIFICFASRIYSHDEKKIIIVIMMFYFVEDGGPTSVQFFQCDLFAG